MVRYQHHTIQSDNQTETMTFKATDSLGVLDEVILVL